MVKPWGYDAACLGPCETRSRLQSALATNPVVPKADPIAPGELFHKPAAARAVAEHKARLAPAAAADAPTVVWAARAAHKNPPPPGQNPPSVRASSSWTPCKGCPGKVGHPRNFPARPGDARAGPANPPRADPGKASWSECPNWDTGCGRPESQNGCSTPENASGCGVAPQTSPATHPEDPSAMPPRSTPARPPIGPDNSPHNDIVPPLGWHCASSAALD